MKTYFSSLLKWTLSRKETSCINNKQLLQAMKSILARRLPTLNNQLLESLMPGKPFSWFADGDDYVNENLIITALYNGHIYIIRTLGKVGIHLKHTGIEDAIKNNDLFNVRCYLEEGIRPGPCNMVDWAARNGYLKMLILLRSYGIHCSPHAANNAVYGDHFEIVQYLHDNQIQYCTASGANWAAWNGNLEMIQYLREYGIECNEDGANYAAAYGHLEVIQDLRANGIHCTSTGADSAAHYGYLHIVHNLRENGIHCTEFGANWAAGEGHLAIVQDLRENGIYCDLEGANFAAEEGHLVIVQDLRAHNIHCTEYGADLAAGNGHLKVIQDLRAHGIYCTEQGACWAWKNKHLEVVQDLKVHGITRHYLLFR